MAEISLARTAGSKLFGGHPARQAQAAHNTDKKARCLPAACLTQLSEKDIQNADQSVVILSHFSLAEKYSMKALSSSFVDLIWPTGSKFDTKWAASA
jgi:hypothetical protein